MDEQQPFSLWRTGLVYRLGARLAGRDPLDVVLRSLALLLVAWATFVALAAGVGLETGRWDPQLFALPVHVTWFVAVPLLFAAEKLVDDRIGLVMRYLRESGLVPPDLEPALGDLERRARAACGSWTAEVVLLVLAVVVSAVDADFSAGLPALWHDLVALPIYRFLILRWLQRWLVWTWLVAGLARLNLALIGLHPDRAGGLAILIQPSRSFALVTLSLGSVLSSNLAMRMQAGASFESFIGLIATWVVLSVALAVLPMLSFALALARAKRWELYRLGEFARQYVAGFESRWLRVPHGGDALGSADIQSLNDLAGAYGVVHEMRLFPFDSAFLAEATAAAALPILPLYLSSLSVAEITAKLLGILF